MMAGSNRTDGLRTLAIGAVALATLPLIVHALPSPQHVTPDTNQPEITPQIPGADRSGTDRVFLEHANTLTKDQWEDYMILQGDVEFSRGGMRMYCDSAHYQPETGDMWAFGNVSMEQGDTLFIYADELEYDNVERTAILYSDYGSAPVRMINRDVELLTPTFVYDLAIDVGYYNEGGTLKDKKNILTSQNGEYSPTTKSALFTDDVVLRSLEGTDTIYAEELTYNTETHMAFLFEGTRVLNDKGVIYTDNGVYNTNTSVAELYSRSIVEMRQDGTTLTGDTLFYDRDKGYGIAWGNIELVDTADCAILNGDYGYYDEKADSAFVTGRALARHYSQGDTLYLHGRDIYSLARTDTIHIPEDTVAGIPASVRVDTTHVMIAHPRVRFYRSDMQGICDSMRFEQRDTMLYMHRHPVVWSDNRQIFGNVIQVHLNDSTVDRADLPDFGFSAEHIEDEFYNQLSGKQMTAWFEEGEMRRLDVNGNVEAIMLPMENDSTYNKIINVESSYLTASFLKQNLERLKMWPETSGTVTPLYLAKKSLLRLSAFKWYEDLRPTSPDDVFHVPEAMEELMSDNPIPPERPRAHIEPVLPSDPEDEQSEDRKQTPVIDDDAAIAESQDTEDELGNPDNSDKEEIQTDAPTQNSIEEKPQTIKTADSNKAEQ